MKIVEARVDALTLAYRVRIDPGFLAHLRERSEVARTHGRASVTWWMPLPDDEGDGTIAKRSRLGDVPARWADEWPGREVRAVKRLGELRYSRATGAWNITNQPYFRAQILLHGPAEGEGPAERCGACDGIGMLQGQKCGACDGIGGFVDPGWNVEIVWYAETLARWGLRAVLAEGAAIAASWGDVKQARVRRVDLCADVAGWEVAAEDVKRLVKRPRAKWTVDDDGILPPAPGETEPLAKKASGLAVAGMGELTRRRVTGITIGRGGDVSARLYNKRVELERSTADASAEKREAEEARWRDAGWDGEEPITRVEFQIRGMAIQEFGLRDPEAATEPVMVAESDRRGRPVLRAAGTRACVSPDGEVLGLPDRLDWLWASCLDWVRLVVPALTRTGKMKAASRLADDPRWALLRRISFEDPLDAATPIRRFRARASASSAQALGVTLSQAGREQKLREWDESPAAYAPDRALPVLRARLLALKVAEVERIIAWLLEREGSPERACAHLAVRSNATRARFLRYARAAGLSRAGPGPRSIEFSSRAA